VPEATIDIRLLLWDTPTQEQWDSVFIDGDRTVKNDKGEEVTESKNWLQRDIVTNALNFAGSPLEQMLNGVGDLEMPGDKADEPATEPDTAAELAAAQAKLNAAAAAAQAAIVESNKALEGQKTVPKGTPEPMGKSVPQTAEEQLAAAKAIIAQLTGQ